jgi:carboxymethylenebutenolidase
MSAFSGVASALLIALLLGVARYPALADEAQPQALTVPASERQVTVTRFAAAVEGKRPAVIILHGNGGLTERTMPHYARYAAALAAQGIDAYIVAYYSQDDTRGMTTTDGEARGRYARARFRPWTLLVAEMVNAILERPESSQRIGLLGMSQGGFLSATESSMDPRISALVVLYGGMPPSLTARITHLPPLLELHGDADEVVPIKMGNALVAKARELNVPALQTVYPGEGHVFDADPDKADARDATTRTVAFFAQTLK